jgi:hypothetical protein
MPPQRRTPIEYDCDACGAHNADAIRFTRHQNRCKAVRIRAERAYEKCVQLHKKRLAERARRKAERLKLEAEAAARVTAEGSVSTMHVECWTRRTNSLFSTISQNIPGPWLPLIRVWPLQHI